MRLNFWFKYRLFSRLEQYILRFLFFICFCFNLSVHAQNKGYFMIVLDAGHGGKDPGKVGLYRTKEKDIALNIALKTGEILSKIPGMKVLYTREEDVFIDLWKRADIANEAHAELFVSIHCNSHTSKSIGTETWVLGVHANERNFDVVKSENEVILQEQDHQSRYQGFDPRSPTSLIALSLEQEEYLDQSLLIASIVQKNFEKSLKRVNRGVKQAGFVVLYQTYMPSILIEIGFLSNPIEAKYLKSPKRQKEIAAVIANSIKEYYERQKLNNAVDEDRLEKDDKSSDVTFYRIQIASSKNKIKILPFNFKGLKGIEVIKVGDYYRYYFGKTTDYQEAKKNLIIALDKYKNAFIITFSDKKGIFLEKNRDL